jgi:hypothetical protein
MPVIGPGQEILDLYSFTDGLKTRKSGIRVGPSELKNCQNIRYFPLGGFMWRQGYTTLGNNPNAACTGLYMAQFSTGNKAIRTQGTKVEKMDDLDGTWDDITNGVVLTASQNNLFSFAMLNDIVIGANGVDNAIQISSAPLTTTVGALPGSAIPTYVYEHRGYMFYVTDNALYFSDINTPATVQTNNFIRVAGKNGGKHVSGVDYNGKNYVWKKHGIYATEYQPTRVNSAGDLFPFIENANPVVPGVGTLSARSVIKFTTPASHKTPGQELVFFVDQFGVPRLFDGSTSLSIGESILTARDSNVLSLSNMDRTRLPYVWALNDSTNNLIYVFMSSTGQTKHDVCWVLDYNMSFAWCRDSYADTFNSGAMFETTDGIYKPYFGNYLGQVMEMNSGQSDNGTAIVSKARTGDLFVGKAAVLSKWLYNEIRGTSGDEDQPVLINYYVDGEDSPSVTGTATLFKQGQANYDEVNFDEANFVYVGLTTKSSEINVEAKTLSVEFYNVTSGYTAAIEGCSLFVIPQGWKQEA